LRAARGLLVGFPDDDCWYDATVLSAVSDRFASDSRLDGLTGVTRDELGAFSVGRFDETPGEVSRDSVWRRGNSTTIFVTRRLAEQVNGFDESLGVGAASPWQSGEETDFLLRALKAGARIQFDPRLVVRHPQALSLAGSARRKAVLYSRGYMKVVRRHQFGVAFEIRSILVPLVGSLVHVARGRYERAALSFWTALGRLGAVIWPGQP
jgi:GT2 family glycosyltransferase